MRRDEYDLGADFLCLVSQFRFAHPITGSVERGVSDWNVAFTHERVYVFREITRGVYF
jgi:hypothetical protein